MSSPGEPNGVDEIREMLADVYKPAGIDIWLYGRNASIDGMRPIDLLYKGEFEAVRLAVERLASGAM